MSAFLISLGLAIAIVAAWAWIGGWFAVGSPWYCNDHWLTNKVACPHCESLYTAREIEARFYLFTGAGQKAAVKCSSCQKTAEFGFDEESLVFAGFAPEDLICLECDSWHAGLPDNRCPYCGWNRIASAEHVEGTFSFRAKRRDTTEASRQG